MTKCPAYLDRMQTTHSWVHPPKAKGEQVICQTCGKRGIVFSNSEAWALWLWATLGMALTLLLIIGVLR